MAVLINRPVDSNPDTIAWQILLNRVDRVSNGWGIVDFTEKQSEAVPLIMAGSRFELNGSYWECLQDEVIEEWTNTPYGWVYAYAVPNLDNTLVRFIWSNEKPVFRVDRGGYFHPTRNERCILSARKSTESGCLCKALYGVRGMQYQLGANTRDAVLILNTEQDITIPVEAGWYRISGRGGIGGRTGTSGQGGDDGSTGVGYTINLTFTQGNPPQPTSWSIAKGSITHSARQGRAGLNGGTVPAPVVPVIPQRSVWLDEGILTVIKGRAGRNGSNGGSGSAGTAGINSQADLDYPYKGRAAGGFGGYGGVGMKGETGEPTMFFNNGKLIGYFYGGDGSGYATRGRPGQHQNFLTGMASSSTAATVIEYHVATSQDLGSSPSGADGSNGSSLLSTRETDNYTITLYAMGYI